MNGNSNEITEFSRELVRMNYCRASARGQGAARLSCVAEPLHAKKQCHAMLPVELIILPTREAPGGGGEVAISSFEPALADAS